MQRPPEVPVKPDKSLLKPDAFWDLIENLLLHTSRDEQTRIRHNISVSALCRGHSIPRNLRYKKAQTTESKPNKSRSNNTIKLPKRREATSNEHRKSTDYTYKKEPSSVVDSSAKKTKSECNVSDLDIIFLKDPKVPKSDQLWRFALRNKQQKEGRDDEEDKQEQEPLPSVRSNKAIFEGLKKRLEDARKEEMENSKDTKKNNPKNMPKQKSRKLTKHQCKRAETTNAEINMDCAKSNENKSNSVNHPGNSPVEDITTPLIKQHAESPSITNDLCQTAVKQLIETSDSSCTNHSSETSTFESAKSQYDSVLKKRMHCGNQLDRLNREIVYKKINPRLVLNIETTRKYLELKADYLKLCCQESSLRHQIAMLQAEIYMMQNKNFHKTPAVIKTIILDSKSVHVPQTGDTIYTENGPKFEANAFLFPPLKQPRPLITPQTKPASDHTSERIVPIKRPNDKKKVSTITKQAGSTNNSRSSFPSINTQQEVRGVCSLYSLTTSLKPPPKRQPAVLLVPSKNHNNQIETTHRLPKMSVSMCS